MLKRRLCEARIEWQLECAGPLLIADGRYTPPKSDNREDRGKYPDKVFVSHANAATIDRMARRQPPAAEALLDLGFYVPGTSLRGPFRAQAERMIRSLVPEDMPPPATACDPFEADDKPLGSCSHRLEAHPPSVPYAAACPACKLFGCTGTASRIRFTKKRREAPSFTAGRDRRWARRARCPSGQSDPGDSRALNGRGEHGSGGPVLEGGEDVHRCQYRRSHAWRHRPFCLS